MPNWCNNELTISHADPAMMARFEAAFKEGRMLNEFIPVPQELRDTLAGYAPEGYERELHEATEALNLKYFGYKNWYDFCVNEWGTKWDVGGNDAYISEDFDGSIHVSFESAWAPPVPAYEIMVEMGFKIKAFYYESGCNFAGRFVNGEDCCYDLPETWEEARAILPDDLIDVFDLEENYRIEEEIVTEELEHEAPAKNP